MFVRYCVREDPFFVFDSSDVPADHYVSYDYDSAIFAYLNSHLLPTDVVSFSVTTDGLNSSVYITYFLDVETLSNMPPFEEIEDADIPF